MFNKTLRNLPSTESLFKLSGFVYWALFDGWSWRYLKCRCFSLLRISPAFVDPSWRGQFSNKQTRELSGFVRFWVLNVFCGLKVVFIVDDLPCYRGHLIANFQTSGTIIKKKFPEHFFQERASTVQYLFPENFRKDQDFNFFTKIVLPLSGNRF